MMNFSNKYFTDSKPKILDDKILDELDHGSTGFKLFMLSFSGCSFENGLYRIHSISEIRKWTKVCNEVFNSFQNRIVCFASDWLGRQFALDFNRIDNNERLVLMMEPGSGESFEIPSNFLEFHNHELVNYQEETLALSFYQKWLNSGGIPPDTNQ